MSSIASRPSAGDAIDRYLEGVRQKDWALLESAVAPDIVRRSPFTDEAPVKGRTAYVAFNRNSIMALHEYRIEIRDRVISADGRQAFVRGHEWVWVSAAADPVDYDLVLWIDLDESGLISAIDGYIKQLDITFRRRHPD